MYMLPIPEPYKSMQESRCKNRWHKWRYGSEYRSHEDKSLGESFTIGRCKRCGKVTGVAFTVSMIL